ncbi:MAG: hypothetical protein HN580_28205 [Deltaproteobacteria bacterium]|nr:hypothetical protein [Deltaproteobacteria bacterium]MBT7892924.1 hypothetical protein [Deltaproteobacteria bacterium]
MYPFLGFCSPEFQDRSWLYSVYIQVFPINVKETRRQTRDRKASPLWQIFNRCYQAFEDMYDAKFEKRFGFFRAVIGESVRAFLKCGDLKQGFARIRCPSCGNEQILSLAKKGVSVDPAWPSTPLFSGIT